jgi:hypothetical protein
VPHAQDGHRMESRMSSVLESREEAGVSQGAPLSYGQQQLWLIDQLQGNSVQYNLPDAQRIRGPLSVDALILAINDLVLRHHSLRTRYVETPSGPIQKVVEANIEISVEDFSSYEGEEREAAAASAVEAEWKEPFDLASGKLLRVRLIKLGSEEHILIRTIHHIAFDGWSHEIFDNELAYLYDCHAEGKPAALAPLETQFVDFARFDRSRTDQDVWDQDLLYWRRKLYGSPYELTLPRDRERTKTQGVPGSGYLRVLSSSQLERLKVFCRSCRVTPFVALLSLYGILLSRYSSQDSLVVGYPTTEREQAQFKNIIGFFAKSMILRFDIDENMSFRNIVSQVNSDLMDGELHRLIPFEAVVEKLYPRRDTSITPVFQSTFSYQPRKRQELLLSGLNVSPMKVGFPVRFDVELYCWRHQDELELHWLYNPALFDHWRMAQLADHYITLLEAVLDAPDRAIRCASLLSEDDKHRLLDGVTRTRGASSSTRLSHPDGFEQIALQDPDAVMKGIPAERVEHGMLFSESNRFTRHLKHAGIGAGHIVGAGVPLPAHDLACTLGTLKNGAPILEFDGPGSHTTSTPESISFADCVAGSQGQSVTPIREGKAPVPTAKEVCERGSVDNRDAGERASDLIGSSPAATACIRRVYRSEGKALDVLMKQSTLASIAEAFSLDAEGELPHGPDSRAKGSSTVSNLNAIVMMTGGRSVNLPLCSPVALSGNSACQHDDRNSPYPRESGKSIGAEYSKVADRGNKRAIDSNVAGSTGHVGGAVCLKAEGNPRSRVYQYAETGAIGLLEEGRSIGDGGANPARVRSLSGVEIYVLDQTLNLAVPGIIGEIYVSGNSLSIGYQDRPGETASSFIANPYGGTGSRMYRTGDLGRWSKDGEVELLGSLENHVQVQGVWIDLVRIEKHLQNESEFAQAAVAITEDASGKKQVTAYVVPRSEREVEFNEVRRCLKQSLPECMVPVIFLSVGHLPLRGDGSVDRALLLRSTGQSNSGVEDYVAPETYVQEVVCGMFSEVLEIELIGIHDNFFDLGGHSLLVTQIMNRIRSKFQIRLPMHSIFDNGSPFLLAEEVERNLLLRDNTTSNVGNNRKLPQLRRRN